MSKHISRVSFAALLALAIAVAGCGGGGGSAAHTSKPAAATSSAGHGDVLNLSADPGGRLRFIPSTLTAGKPGTITLRMANPTSAGIDHAVAIEGNGVQESGPIVAAGKTSTVTATLKPGTYTFYCPVPGHKQAGMVGTLTVK
jgi:plastocyanin